MRRSIILVSLIFYGLAYAHGPPDMDGPGSWGVLQDTVLLKDLVLVKTSIHEDKAYAHIRDKFGDEHMLFKNSFIGENTGKIVFIGKTHIVIEQVVKSRNGGWVTKKVTMKLVSENK